MSERSACILVLALGNDLLGDDGVGLEAARQIAGQVDGSVEVVETGEAGLALLELMEGYERALLIDSVVTGRYPPGTVKSSRQRTSARWWRPRRITPACRK